MIGSSYVDQLIAQRTIELTDEAMHSLKQRLGVLLAKQQEMAERLHQLRADGPIFKMEQSLLRFIEAESAKISMILQRAGRPAKKSRQKVVHLGSTVTLRSSSNKETTYRLVSPFDFHFGGDALSEESALGRALLGKALQQVVRVMHLNGRLHHYTIVAIK